MSIFNDETIVALDNDFKESLKKRTDKLCGADAKLWNEINGSLSYRYSSMSLTPELESAKLFDEITEKGMTPSKLLSKYSKLLDTVIPKQYIEDYLYIIDKCNQFQYSLTYYRPSIRTADYYVHLHTILYSLRSSNPLWVADRYGLAKLYSGQAGEKETEYFFYISSHNTLLCYILAARIDRGDKALEDALYNCIMSEGGVISYTLIRAVIMSDSDKLHDALCKLLLAAKLQEGVRQAICENADCGTVKAFLAIFRTICENNLIRFSSVKRAIATWTGLGEENSAAIDRLTQKQVTLISECLHDSNKRREYIKSDDAMQLYMALWAEGFFDSRNAATLIKEIAESGNRHQILCASAYLSALHWNALSDDVARTVIAKHSDDFEIVAAYYRYYLCSANLNLQQLVKSDMDSDKRRLPLSVFRMNREEAHEHYQLMQRLHESMPKKELIYSPFIFPWYTVALSKSDIAFDLCVLAYALDETDKLDECCGLIQTVANQRSVLLNMYAANPVRETQYDLLVSCIADRETYTQRTAAKLSESVSFREKDYLTLEGMMKYKNGDIRTTIISILMRQGDAALCASIERMIAAKPEEIRIGALDIIINLSRINERKECFEKAREAAANLDSPSAKEQILLDQILGKDDGANDIINNEGFGLYRLSCEADIPDVEAGDDLFSFFDGLIPECKRIAAELDTLFDKNKNLEYTGCNGNQYLLGNHFVAVTYERTEKPLDRYPFPELWRNFYAEHINNEKALLLLSIASPSRGSVYNPNTDETTRRRCDLLFGKLTMAEIYSDCKNGEHIGLIFHSIANEFVGTEVSRNAAKALIRSMLKLDPEKLFWDYKPSYSNRIKTQFCLFTNLFRNLFNNIKKRQNDTQALESLIFQFNLQKHIEPCIAAKKDTLSRSVNIIHISEYILAYSIGFITKEYLFKSLFENPGTRDSIGWISRFAASRLRTWERNQAKDSLGVGSYSDALLENDSRFMQCVREVYEDLLSVILPVELKRGDSETVFSQYIHSIEQIYGAEHFVQILTALGKDTLDRTDNSWSRNTTKRSCLSHLLGTCKPNPEDTAKKLSALVKPSKISEQRLVEAAMYAPDWIPIVGEVLGWDGFVSGCYYFIAHMKSDGRDDRRNALIARYTPLSPEELRDGAFDLGWFNECYSLLGEKRFAVLYSAAKYISDGARHSRARKYADAVLGKLDAATMEKEISDKRNKDSLMAYSLIPLKNDTLRRYRFIQAFLKQSKSFGAQRKQSEGIACSMAMRNLALNAGYSDTMRLTLAMETALTSELSVYFEWHDIGDIRARIVVDEAGHSTLAYEKNGKPLKNAPAALKKDPYLNELKDTHKSLTEQYSRTKAMFEQAMEDRTEFSHEEIELLLTNPVAGPIVSTLVYIRENEIGLISDGLPQSSNPLRIAHPFDLYAGGKWHELQHTLFERQIKQPFKQVFRELYVKTDDERQQLHSLRYAGNQIQPKRTVAALKSRRWVADYEEGLQKIFYKENIVARIYALADWFSPADIEAPTLEWVEFSDRKTGQPIKIDDIPDIIFSEVMRDVDLAVSVAHAGGVDPETSHSTIELRRAIVEFNLPLFSLSNVTLTDHHAVIKGSRAEYSVHLGSGVIHQMGGAQIAVLPVHSQHRGRLFLPFVDEDPKTAEIISKIVMFAEDKKIKDPSILSQIK